MNTTLPLEFPKKITLPRKIRLARMRTRSRSRLAPLAALLLGLATAPAQAAPPAPDALPTGGRVVAGSARIQQAGNRMTIHQETQKVIANWRGFDIGKDAAVAFKQPGPASVALNRVVGQHPSRIFGRLSANGQVMLVNPAGVVFGPGSQLNVGGITASTLAISDADFLDGDDKYHFRGNAGAGGILNRGAITTESGGIVALVAPVVRNEGEIRTPQGATALAAGESVTLDFTGDGLLSVTVEKSALDALAENKGLIRADEGRVILAANAAHDLLSGAVNNTGVIEARGITRKGGRILLEGGDVTNTGALRVAGDARHDGGEIRIRGGFVALGGDIGADGASGGRIAVKSRGTLSLAGQVHARGIGEGAHNGDGGAVTYRAGGRLIENSDGVTDVSGTRDGGVIEATAQRLLTSGQYRAEGGTGGGGRIHMSAREDIRLLSARLDASGETRGGLVRVGGEFQGGKAPSPDTPERERFVGRWGSLPALGSAETTFINDGVRIDVSAAAGEGGTAIVWSEGQTTLLGAIDARGGARDGANGAARGGVVELSSRGELRHAGLGNVKVGGGGHLLLDPKDITIGAANNWAYAGILGTGYSSGAKDTNVSLDASDYSSTSVALNDAGDRLAVGVTGDDDGPSNGTESAGAVYLFSFSDADFSGGALRGTMGKGYTGGNNLDVSTLEANDYFGRSVALNGAGDRLAVGARSDDGPSNEVSTSGAVYLFSFSDTDFTGGEQKAILGKGYTGAKDVDVSNLGAADRFGTSVALNGAGDRLAVGATDDDGVVTDVPTNTGAVYLFSFSDTNFSGGALQGTMGKGYTGGNNVDVSTLEASDYFGRSVALNGAGDRLAVGVTGDDGPSNGTRGAGAVYLFSFSDADFSGGEQKAILGKGYGDDGDIRGIDVANLAANDEFGSSVALNGAGDRLAVGASGDGGAATGGEDETGAVYLFGFSDRNFSGGEQKAILGKGYQDTGNIRGIDVANLGESDYFGSSVALNSAGDRLAVGAYGDDGAASGGASNAGAVYLFMAPGDPISDAVYATRPGGSLILSPGSIASQLSAGTAVTLQASNDITVGLALIANNSGGNGGVLTLQAGRSLLLNADITTDNGNLTLIANDATANGVVDAQRDAGAAVITMAAGTSITAGTGTVTIELRDGAGKTNTTSGDISLRDITASAISAVNNGPTAGSGIVLDGTLAASATTGNGIVLAGDGFTNNTGASALATGTGSRWLVWSGDPANDTPGGLVPGFEQYDASYGVTTVSSATGHGFLHATAAPSTGSATGSTTTSTGAANRAGIDAFVQSLVDSLSLPGDIAAAIRENFGGEDAVISDSFGSNFGSLSEGFGAEGSGPNSGAGGSDTSDGKAGDGKSDKEKEEKKKDNKDNEGKKDKKGDEGKKGINQVTG